MDSQKLHPFQIGDRARGERGRHALANAEQGYLLVHEGELVGSSRWVGHMQQAEGLLRNARNFNPYAWEGLVFAAELHSLVWSGDRLGQVLTDLKAAQVRTPDAERWRIFKARSRVHGRLGDLSAALADAEALAERLPRAPWAQRWLARARSVSSASRARDERLTKVYEALEAYQPKASLDAIEPLIKQKPLSPEVRLAVARVQDLNARFGDAIRGLRRLVGERRPGDRRWIYDAHLLLAKLNALLGDVDLGLRRRDPRAASARRGATTWRPALDLRRPLAAGEAQRLARRCGPRLGPSALRRSRSSVDPTKPREPGEGRRRCSRPSAPSESAAAPGTDPYAPAACRPACVSASVRGQDPGLSSARACGWRRSLP